MNEMQVEELRQENEHLRASLRAMARRASTFRRNYVEASDIALELLGKEFKRLGALRDAEGMTGDV